MKKIILITICFCGLLCYKKALAQNTQEGQIISVNHEFSIAFTDLNKSQLEPGDIVSIRMSDEKITYLEVLESSNTISKLTPIHAHPQFETRDFEKITIGQTVSLKEKGVNSPSTDEAIKIVNATSPVENRRNIKLEALQEELTSLKKQLQKTEKEKANLERQNLKILGKLDATQTLYKRISDEKIKIENDLVSLQHTYTKDINQLKKTIDQLKTKLENVQTLLNRN